MNSKLNPFGNADDLVPSGLLPGKPEWLRVLAWWARNPLHNFFFHWVGFAGGVTKTKGEFLTDGFKFAATKSKHFWFPLISYKGKRIEWYAGWRFNGGLGVAFRVANSRQIA